MEGRIFLYLINRSCPAVALAKEESSRSYSKLLERKNERKIGGGKLLTNNFFPLCLSFLGFLASCENLSFREWMVLSISECCEFPPPHITKRSTKGVCPFIIASPMHGARVFLGGLSVTQPVGLGSRVIAPLVRLQGLLTPHFPYLFPKTAEPTRMWVAPSSMAMG